MKRLTHPVVLQYRRPESLTDGSIHYGGLIVPAQRLMASVYARSGRGRACDINTILEVMLPHWYASYTLLQQHLLLSELLESRTLRCPDHRGDPHSLPPQPWRNRPKRSYAR